MSVINDLKQELKSLQSRYDENMAFHVSYSRAAGKIQKEMALVKDKIKQEEKRLESLKTDSAIHITDHAIVRYLERVLGLDIESFRQQILKGELGQAVRCFETGRFPVKGVDGNVKAVVEGGKIITFR